MAPARGGAPAALRGDACNNQACRVQALDEYMLKPRFVCLGDVIALEVKQTPLLGPMQTAESSESGEEATVALLKVVALTSHRDGPSHRGDVRSVSSLLAWRIGPSSLALGHPCAVLSMTQPTSRAVSVQNMTARVQAPRHALLWSRNASTLITSTAGSALPVGAHDFLLAPPLSSPAGDPGATAAEARANGLQVAALGRTAFAATAEHHEVEAGKLVTGVWRRVATQMLPFLHASSKAAARSAPDDQRGGRATVLLTGPERGGKAMEVAAAAAALGLHVMEVDCRGFTAGPMDEAEGIAQLLEVVQQVRSDCAASSRCLSLCAPSRSPKVQRLTAG